ncbi:MAG: tRNA-specific adenosine deaminase [Chlamydiales bacterium]|nr:tRNA-specific adenosine deaminase [Chlamydiales bacterium]MCH9620404.1 tRNA-specific adenosine deaminase [Chlamydiales bacterium]MCH9622950.1 tRNA-specific adenosine deaminase [Chlamydiales bacterium]
MDDTHFMKEALAQARRAYREGEVPVGCVIVSEGRVIGRGYNQVELLNDATAHAEMVAMGAAANALDNWRLLDTTLYCTIEPCTMCAGAMLLSRIKRLVYGAPDIRHGACGSFIDVFATKHPTHSLEITSGILDQECGNLLREFFSERRNSKSSQ